MNMSKITISLLVLIFSSVIFGCATSLKQDLQKIDTGMDKSDVLNLLGSPWITRRVKTQDHWIYRFYEADQEYRKQFVFEYGKVVKMSGAKPFPNPEVKLKDAGNIEEFRDAAKMKQKKYNSGFKPMDDQSNDD